MSSKPSGAKRLSKELETEIKEGVKLKKTHSHDAGAGNLEKAKVNLEIAGKAGEVKAQLKPTQVSDSDKITLAAAEVLI